jgi:hypothetical protein
MANLESTHIGHSKLALLTATSFCLVLAAAGSLYVGFVFDPAQRETESNFAYISPVILCIENIF